MRNTLLLTLNAGEHASGLFVAYKEDKGSNHCLALFSQNVLTLYICLSVDLKELIQVTGSQW